MAIRDYIKRKLPLIGFLILFCFTYIVRVYHMGTMPPPKFSKPTTVSKKAGRWIDKKSIGMHHLILEGAPLDRGLASGAFTADLLDRQEADLVESLNHAIPSVALRKLFFLVLMRWFWGADRWMEPWMLAEMYGVSKSASDKYNYLADPYTRQLAYHGLHEVGQYFVDQEREDLGCTVFAVPTQGSWVIGRNFDFEAGRIFDEEKIVKWVFPNEGHAFVSVIWAGMVGAVTGVNEHGVYISINAAGSEDFRRYGTPSTLVLLKALQFAKNAKEAVDIIEKETMFITDIFIVSDSSDVAYRVEKSPRKQRTLPFTNATVITNHLTDPIWEKDKVNRFRMDTLTTMARWMRGTVLLESLSQKELPPKLLESTVLSFLRDKTGPNGERLHLGNRKAIDSLIATHAIVYNGVDQRLFVSQGPAVSGAFIGYDLKRSFAERRPFQVGKLPPDEKVSVNRFYQLKDGLKKLAGVERAIKKDDCEEANHLFSSLPEFEHTNYYTTQGNLFACQEKATQAKAAWEKALALNPAYAKQRLYLRERLNE